MSVVVHVGMCLVKKLFVCRGVLLIKRYLLDFKLLPCTEYSKFPLG